MGVNPGTLDFFVAGGTLRPDSASYVKRSADDELFNSALTGAFCYVLTARQMGKSSLMVRTARRLTAAGVSTAVIDLTGIGTVSVDEWYVNLLTELQFALDLSVDPETWWQENASLGPVKRFTSFLRQVVLTEIEGPVTILIDEIDTTLNLEFSDDFFAAIRYTYNARATDPAFGRLTFILLGVATPADLIKDRSRTPFNIGHRINLREFSWEDAQVLQQGLKAAYPDCGEAIFARIFYWTNGHPYLTQKLCLAAVELSDRQQNWTSKQVDELVARLFLSEEARKETNLQAVQDNVNASPHRQQLLSLYRKIYQGKSIPENERSVDQNRLKLFGLVKAEKGLLKVRNEIYRHVFNLNWIKANTPVDWTRRLAAVSTLLVLLLAVALGFYAYWQRQRTVEVQAQTFVDNFRDVPSADVRLTSLAGLFELSGFENRARQLFYQELSPTEQLVLFELADPHALGVKLITSVKGLYTESKNTEYDNRLLQSMARSLRELDDPAAINLATEIEQWLEGRARYAQGDYEQAITMYDVAISLNSHNPGTYFDRALAYLALGETNRSLADFETVLSLDESKQAQVRQAVVNNPELYTALWHEEETYRTLARLVPTPTVTPTPTKTATAGPIVTQIPAPRPTRPASLVDVEMSPPLPTSTSTPSPTPTVQPPTPTFTPAPTPAPATIIYVQSNIGRGHTLGIVSSTGKLIDAYFHNYAAAPAWSPDGTKIAFFGEEGISEIGGVYTQGNGVWIVDAHGENPRQLLAIDHVKNIVWSPDNTKLAFELGPPGVTHEIMVVDSEEGREVSRFPGEQAAWNPNSQNLVIRSCAPDCGLWQVNLDGSGGQQLTNDSTDSYPVWSPSGEYLVFASKERHGNWEIYRLRPSDETVLRLTRRASTETTPVFSRDGQEIYYRTDLHGSWQIAAMKLDGRDERLVMPDIGPSDDWGLARPSVYSEIVAPVATPRPPTATPAPTATPTPLPPPTPTPTVVPEVIYKLVYTKWDGSQHNVYVADTNGENEQLIVSRGTGPSWTPDGAFIFFGGEPGVDRQIRGGVEYPVGDITEGIIRLNASPLPGRADQLRLFQSRAWRWGGARWTNVSPDGKMVAFDAQSTGDFRIYFFDTTENRKLPFEIDGEQADWSPDSKKLVYRSGRGGKTGIWISNHDDTGHLMITNNSTDSLPVWSPDGETIAFSREVDGNVDIYTINVDGSNLRRLTDAPGHDTLPVYTPSGDIIFRSARNGNWGVWKMRGDGGSQVEIIANANVGPVWAYSKMDVQ